ncbi:hypothetical protein B0T14DRAFT_432661 [Immersiella caudata]|uniref:Macro domain-containing protein n=1 Tax=Immersiella caudata TaxID=314043 RepID=A0AA39WRY6_9PEZI|nr:hypothetical protein B0T14DRAFT_432661 [Immersiella caudata]
MSIVPASQIPSLSLLYKLGKIPPAAASKPPPTLLGPSTLPTPSKSLNDRVAIVRGDITKLRVSAIVNAANNSLRGGGGVDGAIHRAAGPGLLAECRTLNGCPTGSAKITRAYNLPCDRVIHAVGPIYSTHDPEKSERELTSAYTTSLKLAADNGCKTVAFSALSTGVYGYPSRAAAPAALSAVRKFMKGEDGKNLDKVVIVTFEKKDVDAYNEALPLFFPPEEKPAAAGDEQPAKKKKAEAELEAEAQAVANELPSPPKVDPADGDHVEKKQKRSED